MLGVLAALRREQYGYSLRQTLGDHGLAIEESTLYPLLRRLEAQGLLSSSWREHDKRNKRFYKITHEGRHIFQHLIREWESIDSSLKAVVKEQEHGTH